MGGYRRGKRLFLILLCTCPLQTGCGGGDPQGEVPSVMRWGGDVVGGGSEVTVSDSVPGDVIVAGGRLGFVGVAGGDILAAGRVLEIGGRVLGDVRAAGGEVRFSGQVARNVTAAGREVRIGDGATIGRNAYLAGRQIRVEGTISGSLRSAGAEIVLNGTVDGNVDVRGGSLRVGPEARITGDLTHHIPAENVLIDSAAQIGGSVRAYPTRPGAPIGLFRVLLSIGFLLAGAVAVAIFARSAVAAEGGLRQRPGAALGFGLLWLLLLPIGIAAIAITGVGLPLALILLALFLISLYLARAVTALWLGRLILRGQPRPGRGPLVSAFLIGGVVLLLIGLIPIVGGIVALVATVLGLGSLVVAYRGRREHTEEI